MTEQSKFVRIYFGRMSVEIPAASRYGVSFRNEDFQMRARPWPLPAAAPAAAVAAEFQKRWDEFLAEERVAPQTLFAPEQEIDLPVSAMEAPLVRTMHAKAAASAESEVTTLSMWAWRGVVVKFIRTQPCAKEAEAQELVQARGLLQGLVSRMEEIAALPKGTTFGADDLLLATLRFKHVPHSFAEDYAVAAFGPEMQGDFSARSYIEVEWVPSLLRRFGGSDFQGLLAQTGISVRVPRRGNRQVAGLRGEELCVSDAEPPKGRRNSRAEEEAPNLHFAWEYRAGGSHVAPKPYHAVQILFDATSDREPEKLARWDHLLNSMRHYGPSRR